MSDPSTVRAAGAQSVDHAAMKTATSFALQTAGAVLVIHLLLLAPYVAGWINGVTFATSCVVLSSAAIGAMSYRTARVLNNVRDAIIRFWSATNEGPSPLAANGSWNDLDASLVRVHESTRQRLIELKASREAVARQSTATRRIADHLLQAQRIARVGSYEWERTHDRIVCSEEVFRLLRVDRSEFRLTTRTLLELMHEDDRRAYKRWIVALVQGVQRHGLDLRLRGSGGASIHLHVLGEALRDDGGRTTGVIGTIQDATERTHAIQQIHRLAYYDVLTELPNRSRFHEKLAETLENARRLGKSFALMFLDLDQFKRINDTLGHAVGDDLLRIVAQRLTRVLRSDDASGARGKAGERDVCRQGGDEFIVLLHNVASEEQAGRAANRVIEALAQPIVIGPSEIFVSASIGIVLHPRDGESLDALLKNADVAMYHAKAEGRNRYAFYHDSMRQATAQRLSLEHDLRRAIESEQFELHYQPQINVATQRITGMEALIRWNHPTLGMLWPQHFIPVAEEAGLIMAIWEWVFVSALIQHNAWREEGLPPIAIGVNLSSTQFTDRGFADRVKEIAEVVGVPMQHIELELTESALVHDFDGAQATLQQLRGYGVKIAIDDFGTGYSSLSYLRRLPLDKLKLDHSFTADAVESEEGAAIARAIIAMAGSLKLSVVAEGVETQQQIDTLCEMGCTTMQGYLLSRPLSVAAMSQVLHAHFHSEPLVPVAESSETAGETPRVWLH
ncbi:MAG TPA: EAL domain-containing protein [Casimicrobiaceae bacterium]|nr:EAL domain-containing protein [Casimicrobiaceae bacterium]